MSIRDRNRQSLAWWASAAPRRRGYPRSAIRQQIRFFAMTLPSGIETTRRGLRAVL